MSPKIYFKCQLHLYPSATWRSHDCLSNLHHHSLCYQRKRFLFQWKGLIRHSIVVHRNDNTYIHTPPSTCLEKFVAMIISGYNAWQCTQYYYNKPACELQ